MILSDKLIDRLSQDTINKLKKSMFRAVDLIEMFFPDPNDYSKKIKLDKFQKDFVDTIQFGYPLSRFRYGEIVNPPKGVITIWKRQVGKSTCCGYTSAAMMILGPHSIGRPPTRVGIVAASEEESKRLMEKVKVCFMESEFNEFITGKIKVDKITLKNGSYCQSHTCSHQSIRGPSYHYMFIDESAHMEDESIIFSAAIPTVTHGERWVAITTPDGNRGKLIDYYIKGVETRPVICTRCGAKYEQKYFVGVKFPEKNEIWKMPKLPPCRACGGSSYKYGVGIWATPWYNPWESELIPKQELINTLDSHGWSPWARQEFLGEIIDEASMVILEDWIIKCTNDRLRNVMKRNPEFSYVLGVDYGRLHDASCFAVTHLDPKSKRIVLDYMRTVSGEYDYETDYDMIRDHLMEIVKYYRPTWIVPDSTGLGYSQVEMLKKDIMREGLWCKIYTNIKGSKDKPRLGYTIQKSTKPELIGNLITKLSSNPPKLELPPRTEPEINELVKEMLRFECEIMEGGYIKYGTQRYHDDRVIALALALVPYSDKIVPIAKPRGFGFDLPKKNISARGGKRYKNYRLLIEEF